MAIFSDFLGLTFGQNPIWEQAHNLARAHGYNAAKSAVIGHYASVIAAATIKSGTGYYQIAQRLLARVVCNLRSLKLHSRQYANRVELWLEDLGLIDIPKYKTNVDSPPKVRSITEKFRDMMGRHDLSIRATGSFTTSKQEKERHGQAIPLPVSKSNPIRALIGRPARATLFDSNHMRALVKRGLKPQWPGRVDRQFLFHCQKALPDDMVALRFFADVVTRRRDGDARVLEFFEKWKKLRKGLRTSAVIGLYGPDYVGNLQRRELSETDRQVLYWTVAAVPDVVEAIRFFVGTAALRREGDEYVHRFFANWNDLTRWSKRGQVANLLSSLGMTYKPASQVFGENGVVEEEVRTGAVEEERTGAVTALPALPNAMTAEAKYTLLGSIAFGDKYAGPYVRIVAHSRDLSIRERNILIEKIQNLPER